MEIDNSRWEPKNRLNQYILASTHSASSSGVWEHFYDTITPIEGKTEYILGLIDAYESKCGLNPEDPSLENDQIQILAMLRHLSRMCAEQPKDKRARDLEELYVRFDECRAFGRKAAFHILNKIRTDLACYLL